MIVGSILDRDWAFIAHQRAQFFVSEHVTDFHRPAVHDHPLAHQADAVAVIDVPIDMADVERLDRLAVSLMPAVDGDAMRFFRQAIGEHDVFLDPGDELAERLVPTLVFDELVVLEKRGRCFAVFGEWPGLEP